jgi:hypothetical protein
VAQSQNDLAQFAGPSDEWIVAARDQILEELRRAGHEMAEDAAQHAALKALELRRDGALAAMRDPLTYLRVVAHNYLRDRGRWDRRHRPLGPWAMDLPACLIEALSDLEACEDHALVHAAIALLPWLLRRVIKLYYFELEHPTNEEVGLALWREGLVGGGTRRALGQRARLLRINHAEPRLRALILRLIDGPRGPEAPPAHRAA